jgi:hypothetical protein
VARVFSDVGQSAKAAGRDAFQGMFRYLEANTGKVSHIIVYKYYRFRGTSMTVPNMYPTKI